jgi:alpha-beta hydrolase superfamily lysophospholipase
VSTSITHEAAGSGPASLTTDVVRHSAAQPTRRAVLHVQGSEDPPVPADLVSWFTERGFHFYVAAVRPSLSARPARAELRRASTDLDAVLAQLRDADGMVSVIVTANGRAAVTAARWSASRPERADALILSTPAWPARRRLRLEIACPVLVIGGRNDAGSTAGLLSDRWWARQWWARRLQARRRWARRLWTRQLGRPDAPAMHLGRHVTWLTLADGIDQRIFLTELGRWLGAYMYGPDRDQLL